MISRRLGWWMVAWFIVGLVGAQSCGGGKSGHAGLDAAPNGGGIVAGTSGVINPGGGIIGTAGVNGADAGDHDGCCSAGRCVAGSCPIPTGGNPGTGGAAGAGGTVVTGGTVLTGGTTRTGGTATGGADIGGTLVSSRVGGTTKLGGSTATGGSTGTGGSSASSVPCGPLIDDMESGDGRICVGNGRRGLWYTYVDKETGSSILPVMGEMAKPVPVSLARDGSRYAMHIEGNYSMFAGMACWLNKPSFSSDSGDFDASAYTGITFYAKGNANRGDFYVVGQMLSTEPKNYGGKCIPSDSCVGNYTKITGLSSSEWTKFQVPFTAFKDGTMRNLTPSGVSSFEFQFYRNESSPTQMLYNLWIDDLSFY